jgi:hypothetical protein
MVMHIVSLARAGIRPPRRAERRTSRRLRHRGHQHVEVPHAAYAESFRPLHGECGAFEPERRNRRSRERIDGNARRDLIAQGHQFLKHKDPAEVAKGRLILELAKEART